MAGAVWITPYASFSGRLRFACNIYGEVGLPFLFGKLGNDLHTDAGVGESTIVEEVLHGHVARQVAEQGGTIIGTGLSVCIAQWAHGLAVRDEFVESFYAAARSGDGGRLADGVDADFLLNAVVVAKAAGDALEEALGVGHVAVVWERCAGRRCSSSPRRCPTR